MMYACFYNYLSIPYWPKEVSFISLNFANLPWGNIQFLSIPTSFILWCNSALVNNTNLFRQTWRCKSLINLFYNIPQCSAEETDSRLGATFQLFQPLTLVPVSGNFCDNWLWAHFVATRNILKGTIILMVTHDLNPISCAMQKLHYSFSAQWTRKHSKYCKPEVLLLALSINALQRVF